MLLWSFTDSLAPHAALLSPYDVSTLKFCPSDKGFVVAGLSSGQVCMWKLQPGDLSTANKGFVENKETEDGEEAKQAKKLTTHNYKSLSFIDDSHKKPVMAIQWLRPDIAFGKKGKATIEHSYDGPHKYFVTIVRLDLCLSD